MHGSQSTFNCFRPVNWLQLRNLTLLSIQVAMFHSSGNVTGHVKLKKAMKQINELLVFLIMAYWNIWETIVSQEAHVITQFLCEAGLLGQVAFLFQTRKLCFSGAMAGSK